LAYGIGASAPPTRSTGASRSSKHFARDARRDLGADPVGRPALLCDERARRLGDARADRLGIQWPQRAQIDDLDLDAVLREAVGDRERAADGVAVGDDREIGALAHDLRAADRHREVVARLRQCGR